MISFHYNFWFIWLFSFFVCFVFTFLFTGLIRCPFWSVKLKRDKGQNGLFHLISIQEGGRTFSGQKIFLEMCSPWKNCKICTIPQEKTFLLLYVNWRQIPGRKWWLYNLWHQITPITLGNQPYLLKSLLYRFLRDFQWSKWFWVFATLNFHFFLGVGVLAWKPQKILLWRH